MAYRRNILDNADSFADVAGTENDKYKSRKVAGVPKMNFHVFAIPAGTSATDIVNTGDWIYLGGFKEADGLGSSIEQQDYSDTSTKNVIIKNPGKISFDNITLRRGYDADHLNRQWFLQRGGVMGQSERYMLDLVITKMTSDDTSVARAFLVRNAWVAGYNPDGSDDTTTDPWMESLTIAHDGWMMGDVFPAYTIPADGANPASDVLAGAARTFGGLPSDLKPAISYTYDYAYVNSVYVKVEPGNFLRGAAALELAE